MRKEDAFIPVFVSVIAMVAVMGSDVVGFDTCEECNSTFVNIGGDNMTGNLNLLQPADGIANGVKIYSDTVPNRWMGFAASSAGYGIISASHLVDIIMEGVTLARFGNGFWRFEDNNRLAYGDGYDYTSGYHSATDTFQFVDGGALNTNVIMAMNANRYVGIGIATGLLAELDVNGDIAVRGGDIRDSSGIRRWSITGGGYTYIRDTAGDIDLTVDPDGKVGINTTTPSTMLDVDGNVTADDFITRSAYFDGDAVAVIKDMSGSEGKIDHASAGPASVIYDYDVPVMAVKNVTVCHDEALPITDDLDPVAKIITVCEEKEEEYIHHNETRTFQGISLDMQMAVLIRANQQLIERIEKLEAGK